MQTPRDHTGQFRRTAQSIVNDVKPQASNAHQPSADEQLCPKCHRRVPASNHAAHVAACNGDQDPQGS